MGSCEAWLALPLVAPKGGLNANLELANSWCYLYLYTYIYMNISISISFLYPVSMFISASIVKSIIVKSDALSQVRGASFSAEFVS